LQNIKTGKEWKNFEVQQYPGDNSRFYREVFNTRYPIIDKNTPISSIGSCFAVEIANHLSKNGYNYPLMQDEMTQERKSSADWGAVYNVPCMKQIYQYSFESFNPIVRWWEKGNYVIDPFRRDIAYDKNRKEKFFKRHAQNSYKILNNVEVMIFTLGMSEVWRDKRDKSTFWRVVPKRLYDKNIHEFHIMTVDEIIDDLYEIKRIINTYNPKCKMILTVSPVPFFATFRQDTDVISANFNSKATLKVAVDQFIRNTKNTYYFPSYEYTLFNHINPYKKDNRHVSPKVVNNIMKLFERIFVK